MNNCNCSVEKKEQGYNDFPQIITVPSKFSQINHRSLAIMDGCNKCCETNTVPLK